MPKRFYLNDCLPDHPEEGKNVGELFREMVLNYKELHKNELLDLAQHWVTRDYADNVTLCSITLRSLLGQLKSNPTLFAYASKLVGSSIPLIYEEDQLAGDPELEQEYMCNERDGHYLLVAQKLDMIAASLPVEEKVCCNILKLMLKDIQKDEETTKEIPNWHISNQENIIKLLTPPLSPKTEPWNRLMDMLGRRGRVVYSKEFKDDWDKLGSAIQQLVVQRFEDALNAGLLYPANNGNMDIVKPDQIDKTSKVHELRQKGMGIRVYFECDTDVIYIVLYGSKTVHHGKDQAADFKLAKVIASRLRQGIV